MLSGSTGGWQTQTLQHTHPFQSLLPLNLRQPRLLSWYLTSLPRHTGAGPGPGSRVQEEEVQQLTRHTPAAMALKTLRVSLCCAEI